MLQTMIDMSQTTEFAWSVLVFAAVIIVACAIRSDEDFLWGDMFGEDADDM